MNRRARSSWLLLLIPMAVSAAPGYYITDRLETPLRSDQGGRGEVIVMVDAGAPVEVLIENGDDLLVRSLDGSQGWISRRLLTTSRPLGQRLLELEADRGRLREALRRAGVGAEVDGQPTPPVAPDLAGLKRELAAQRLEREALQARIDSAVALLGGAAGPDGHLLPVAATIRSWWQPLVAGLAGLLVGLLVRRRSYSDTRGGIRIKLG